MAQVKIVMDNQRPLPPPEGANFFALSRVETEVELQVGYIDLHRLLTEVGETEQLEDDTEVEVDLSPEITHRFVMSLSGLHLLKQKVDEIVGKVSAKEAREHG